MRLHAFTHFHITYLPIQSMYLDQIVYMLSRRTPNHTSNDTVQQILSHTLSINEFVGFVSTDTVLIMCIVQADPYFVPLVKDSNYIISNVNCATFSISI